MGYCQQEMRGWVVVSKRGGVGLLPARVVWKTERGVGAPSGDGEGCRIQFTTFKIDFLALT